MHVMMHILTTWEILLLKMNKLLLLSLLLINFLYAKGLDRSHIFHLKKDQIATIDYKNHEHNATLYFRWTLFTSNQLVLLASNATFPTQHILEKRLRLNGVKFDIFQEKYSTLTDDSVYFMLIFDEFDAKKKSATFNVYLRDKAKTLKVKFIDPPEDKK